MPSDPDNSGLFFIDNSCVPNRQRQRTGRSDRRRCRCRRPADGRMGLFWDLLDGQEASRRRHGRTYACRRRGINLKIKGPRTPAPDPHNPLALFHSDDVRTRTLHWPAHQIATAPFDVDNTIAWRSSRSRTRWLVQITGFSSKAPRFLYFFRNEPRTIKSDIFFTAITETRGVSLR